jgi:chromosome segregation ATPase
LEAEGEADMMDHLRGRIAIGAILVAWLLTIGIGVWQAHRASVAENRAVVAERELSRLRQHLSQPAATNAPAEVSPSANPRDERAASARREAQSRGLVAGSEAEIATLESQLSDARAESIRQRQRAETLDEEQHKAAEAANARYATAQADWQTRLDSLTQQLETAHAAAEAARGRAAALEANLAKQTTDQSATQAKLAEARRLLASLEDLNRRRSTYIDSLQRRYRDVLGQLHAIGNVLDASRDRNSSVVSDAALARIENTITLAEDDMRQLGDVNGRAAQAEKRLSQLP